MPNKKTKYTTGQIVPISGIYECTNCDNEITCVKGNKFPPCSACDNTEFILIRETD